MKRLKATLCNAKAKQSVKNKISKGALPPYLHLCNRIKVSENITSLEKLVGTLLIFTKLTSHEVLELKADSFRELNYFYAIRTPNNSIHYIAIELCPYRQWLELATARGEVGLSFGELLGIDTSKSKIKLTNIISIRLRRFKKCVGLEFPTIELKLIYLMYIEKIYTNEEMTALSGYQWFGGKPKEPLKIDIDRF